MFCKHCGADAGEARICPNCGKSMDEQPTIIINNTNTNTNVNSNRNTNAAVVATGRAKNKWVAFALCLCLGFFGAHKFYEGKAGMGLLYLFTGGLFLIGVIIDLIALLGKPNPYYV